MGLPRMLSNAADASENLGDTCVPITSNTIRHNEGIKAMKRDPPVAYKFCPCFIIHLKQYVGPFIM